MAVRQVDQFKVQEYTGLINRVDNDHDIITRAGYFDIERTALPQFTFDLEKQQTVITGTVSEVGRGFDPLTRRSASVHAIQLESFEMRSTILVDDLEGYRELGTENQQKRLMTEAGKRVTDLSKNMTNTHEWLQFTAMQGVTTSPTGETLLDSYAEFGETREEIDFDLGTADSDITAHINELVQKTAANLKSGMATSLPHVFVSLEFFNKLVNHPKVIDAWNSYENSGEAQRNRDSLAMFYQGGANLIFNHRGVTFLSYNPEFPVQNKDGTITMTRVIPANDGFSIPNAQGVMKAVYGSHRKLSTYDVSGQKMYAEEYRDPRDEFLEITASSRCMYFNSNPAACFRIFTST